MSVSIVSRGNGGLASTRSAVAAAAYNSRQPLFDERQAVLRDLTADARDLVRADILLPDHAPERWLDRETLWNEVEATERRVDAQVARAVVLTLPRELGLHANVDLARDFFIGSFVSRGMVADVAVHDKLASDGLPQPHAHGLLTMRRIVDGAFGRKEREWNTAASLQEWRAGWAAMASDRLRAIGVAGVDHRAGERAWLKVSRIGGGPEGDAIQATGRKKREAQPFTERAWVKTAVQAMRVSGDVVRTHAAREAARAAYVVEFLRPRVIATWRRVEEWIDRKREPMSEQNMVDQLRAALHDRGLRPVGDPVMDGRWHRTAVEGDTGAKKSGSYVAHGDGRPHGFISNFKTGESGAWRAEGRYVSDPSKLAADQAARREERERGERTARERAGSAWAMAAPARAHSYLDKKGIDGDGARVTARGDLLIPMRDADGRLWGVQQITPDGAKFFTKGGRVTGTHALLGELKLGETVIVVEGWATAKTVHAETGRPVAAALVAGNLEAVARAYQERGFVVVIGADNDHALPLRTPALPNVGIEKGTAAAAAVGGKVVVPQFAMSDAGTDFNDYVRLHGNGAVRRLFEREGIPVSDSKPAAAIQTETTQAQREAARQAVPVLAQAAVSADLQAQQASARAQHEAQRAHSAAATL